MGLVEISIIVAVLALLTVVTWTYLGDPILTGRAKREEEPRSFLRTWWPVLVIAAGLALIWRLEIVSAGYDAMIARQDAVGRIWDHRIACLNDTRAHGVPARDDVVACMNVGERR
jgi:hypothetical protein